MKIGRVKLKNPLKVYCPIMEATLTINSTLLEQMSEFTQFLLYSIGEGYSINEIIEVVDLGRYIVEEEIEYLFKIGLVYIEDEKYYLSEKGKEYYDVIKIIENIKEDDLKVHINCFNGQIMSPSENTKLNKDLEDGEEKLRVKVVKELYQNKDFSNSREYVFEKLGERFKENENIDIDNIYITIDYERGDLNRPIYIREVESIKAIQDTDKSNEDYLDNISKGELEVDEDYIYDIQLQREIVEVNVQVTYEEIEEYKNVLTTLENLCLFDSTLISDKSKYLLSLWNKQKSIQKTIYFDTVTKEILEEKPNLDFNRELYNIKIENQYSIDDINLYSLEQILKNEEWYREDILVDFKVINSHKYYESISSLEDKY